MTETKHKSNDLFTDVMWLFIAESNSIMCGYSRLDIMQMLDTVIEANKETLGINKYTLVVTEAYITLRVHDFYYWTFFKTENENEWIFEKSEDIEGSSD